MQHWASPIKQASLVPTHPPPRHTGCDNSWVNFDPVKAQQVLKGAGQHLADTGHEDADPRLSLRFLIAREHHVLHNHWPVESQTLDKACGQVDDDGTIGRIDGVTRIGVKVPSVPPCFQLGLPCFSSFPFLAFSFFLSCSLLSLIANHGSPVTLDRLFQKDLHESVPVIAVAVDFVLPGPAAAGRQSDAATAAVRRGDAAAPREACAPTPRLAAP